MTMMNYPGYDPQANGYSKFRINPYKCCLTLRLPELR